MAVSFFGLTGILYLEKFYALWLGHCQVCCVSSGRLGGRVLSTTVGSEYYLRFICADYSVRFLEIWISHNWQYVPPMCFLPSEPETCCQRQASFWLITLAVPAGTSLSKTSRTPTRPWVSSSWVESMPHPTWTNCCSGSHNSKSTTIKNSDIRAQHVTGDRSLI